MTRKPPPPAADNDRNRYREHALREFQAAGWLDKNGEFKDVMRDESCLQQRDFRRGVLRLLDVFHEEGHSGTSAPYAVDLFAKDLFAKLAMFKPIVPLTGEDDEWREIADGFFQNKRCAFVFKENGQAYDSQGRVFVEVAADGTKTSFTSKDSRVPVVFPYTPTREYVEVHLGAVKPVKEPNDASAVKVQP